MLIYMKPAHDMKLVDMQCFKEPFSAIMIAIITMMMMITIVTIDYLKGSIKKTTKLITLKFTYLDISRENELSWTYKYTFTIRFLNISTYGFNSVTFRRLTLRSNPLISYPTYTLKYYNDLYCVRFTLLRTKTTISVGKKKNGTANPHPTPPPPPP